MNINKTNSYNYVSFKSKYNLVLKEITKSDILHSHNINECADKFESFSRLTMNNQLKTVDKVIDKMRISSLFAGASFIAAGHIADIPMLLLAGSLIVGSFFIFANIVLYPIHDKLRNKQMNDIMGGVAKEGFENDMFKQPLFYKYYTQYKQLQQLNLLKIIDSNYKDTEDKENIISHIIQNFGDYYWSDLIEYCIANCSDNKGNANYNNFRNLLKCSVEIYKKLHKEFEEDAGIDFLKNNDILLKCFNNKYPFNNLEDMINANLLKDKAGIISNEQVEELKNLYKKETPQIIDFLQCCHNADNSLAWNCEEIFTKISTLINSSKISDFTGKDELILKQKILNEIAKSAQTKDGQLSEKSLERVYKDIRTEVETVGIIHSEILKNILSTDTQEILGIANNVNSEFKAALKERSILFDKFIKQDKLSIIEFLINTEAKPKEIFKFLCKLTSSNKYAKKIAFEFSRDNRQSKKLYTFLLYKLGDNERAKKYFDIWYHDEENGYRNAYKNYYNQEIYDKSKDLITLVKQSPNLAPWVFIKKAEALGEEPILGNLPQEFGSEKNLSKILFKLSNIANKKNKTEFTLKLNNKSFFVKQIDIGSSQKLKFKITPTDNIHKSYMLKFVPHNNPEIINKNHYIVENQMLRADSPYIDALIDFYLKENKCKNAADIKYFNYNYQAVLYEMTKGEVPDLKDNNSLNIYKFNHSKQLEDVRDLGIIINDIWHTNMLMENGILKLIDTGHASYSDLFRPIVLGKQISLNNMTGRELKE